MTTAQAQVLRRFTDIQHLTERPFVCMDLLRMVFDDKVSEGQSRAVYDFPLKRGYVIKASLKPESNLNEWAVWSDVSKEKNHAKWFAPCIAISPGGHFLIQKKIKPLPANYKLPKKMPCFFTDLKRTNWGLLNGKLVCCDYEFLCSGMDAAMNCSREVTWRDC